MVSEDDLQQLAHQHFTYPRSHFDSLAEKGISWVKSSNEKMTIPFPNLETSMNDPKNIKCKHPIDRPKGFIKVKRLCQKLKIMGNL